MQTNHNDQVIYLKDLLFSVLYRWKRILIFGLILAVLLGGLKGISVLRAKQSKSETISQETLDSLEEEILNKRLETLENSFSDLTVYNNDSILMQLDPSAFYQVSLSAYISTDYQIMPDMVYQTPDLSNVILHSYVNRLKSQNFIQELSDKLNTKPKYIQELISVYADDSTHTLHISVVYSTEKQAQTLLSILAQQLNQIQSEIAQTVQAHRLNIYEQSVYLTSDKSLADRQLQNVQELLELRSSIKEIEDSIESLSVTHLKDDSVQSLLKSVVIFGIIGFFLGVFMMIAVIWVNHLCSNKVYSARTLSNRTQVKVLGCINTIEKMDPITRKLRQLDNRSVTQTCQQSQLIAAYIRNLCANTTHLLVTGNTDSSVLSEALKLAIPGVQISVCGSLLSDVAAVNTLSGCDCVLLVEECDVSRYADVEQVVSIITDNKKSLLGCVLLNG
mgnify:CR=1 FL=1